jgi:phosphoheptose isomerase
MTTSSLIEYLAESREAIDSGIKHNSTAKVNEAITAISVTLAEGKPVRVCGNGGSATDAMQSPVSWSRASSKSAKQSIASASHPTPLC